ncbi:T9SS type A sorting domain-containing protein [Winogradskyella sp. SYSU M77433]|uniref:T9SS type A sorting domain-containing protein n=1 Tax=Winogradskyella sp. SYSU M77433 TaxID=3042722 RepID=UPI00248035D3|nr:T9SS type A sorting domain-containing protein [Winogradskyella sp. SYSU M77433]MDH7912353.1 T9SS type A sorting domain-containing protein [Winogradskyella sp. SYSU M77433]
MKFKLLFTFLFTCVFGFAQVIPDEVKPPSWNLEGLPNVKAHKLASFNLKKLQEEDKINDQDKSKPWRFGHDIYVDHDFNEVGKWTTLDNGDRIWRMAYTSEGALTLNFMFDIFKIPEGAKLYVYNDEKTDLLRPFTHHNNNAEEVLGTWLVEGNKAWIEYYEPANTVGMAKLTIGSVVHGYRTAETYQKNLGDSGDCNHDVDCDITPTSDPFEINTRKEEVKKAAGMLLTGGFSFCSGTLVNNTNNDGTPYFLTANHCGGGEGSWAFRFNWRSPNPSCGTTANSTNGSFNQTVSGAILRAASDESDMELVEITDPTFFNNNPDVVWAGWNRSTTQLPSVNFGVHHPSGDIQKTCRDDDGATRITTGFNGNGAAKMWRIADWDLGVTEGGSSGSGLFNENGHLIGMLSGGSAACAGTNDNGGFDIYGRFGVAWDFGSSTSSRLKEWLDPSDSGVIELGIYPALETYDIDARVTAGSGNSSEICGEDFSPQVTLTNLGNLNLTSAVVSYYLDTEAPTTINWTGNLASDGSVVVATPTYSGLTVGSHSFTINVTNPNSTIDENTSNDNFVFNFQISPSFSTTSLVLNLLTDEFGDETSWEFVNSSGTVVASGPTFSYADETSYVENITIPTFSECYTFTIYDDYDDGMCCDYGIGSYSLEDENGTVIISGGDFGSSESITFNVLDPLSVDEYGLENYISFYPNPVNDDLSITVKQLNDNIDYEVFNMLGQTITKGNLVPNNTNNINMTNYQSGVYFVKLSTLNSSFTKKIMKN